MGTKLDNNNPINNLSEATLLASVQESRSPLIITDYQQPNNPIIYSNQAFLDMTGYSLKDILGKNCKFLQGSDSDKDTVAMLADAVKHGQSTRVDIKNYRKDGSMFWNDLIISPVKNNTGTITHFIGMQLDITERKLNQEKLAKKTRELESSNRELEQFTYATSHDLQEPLRMISSYLQLITKRYSDKLDEDGNKYLGFASEGADRMQELIFDLLTLSRVTSTDVELKMTPVVKVVDRAIHNLRILIDESNADITVKDLPTQSIDPVQITQLFQNLISNAIKYHRKNVIPKIVISAKKLKHETVYSITDNGIGIDEKDFDRIFIVFQRLHTRSEYGGTGIGLAICFRIIERHNGRIWVESKPGQGSAFKFALPNHERTR